MTRTWPGSTPTQSLEPPRTSLQTMRPADRWLPQPLPVPIPAPRTATPATPSESDSVVYPALQAGLRVLLVRPAAPVQPEARCVRIRAADGRPVAVAATAIAVAGQLQATPAGRSVSAPVRAVTAVAAAPTGQHPASATNPAPGAPTRQSPVHGSAERQGVANGSGGPASPSETARCPALPPGSDRGAGKLPAHGQTPRNCRRDPAAHAALVAPPTR